MARSDTVDQRYSATTDDVDTLDNDAAVDALLNGESSTLAAEELPQEFDDLAHAAEYGGLDRDNARLARKTHELEARDITDLDEEGLEGHLKTLHFEEAEGEDGVNPNATRPDAPQRKG